MVKTIILAGGNGTRLWPLSRELYPKQFLKFKQLENTSLFQQAFNRAAKISSLEDIYVVTNEKLKFLVMGEVEELGHAFHESNILIEPQAKNTLPAICYGMQKVAKGESAVVLSADHLIKNEEVLIQAIQEAKDLAHEHLITFGIRPKKVHTGYGYIKHKDGIVEEFKEKPDAQTAKTYIEQGYVWNSGMFLLSKHRFDEELRRHNPQTHAAFTQIQLEDAYNAAQKDSIDTGLLERSQAIRVMELPLSWDDLGSFDSIYDIFDKDAQENQTDVQGAIFKEAKGNLVLGHEKKTVSLCGVDDLIVVDTPDALLVSKKNQSHAIREVVKSLQEEQDHRAKLHTLVHRPWGKYRKLEESPHYKVRRVEVSPHKSLSLQLHEKRNECWIVVKGEARVTLGEETKVLKENESITIPQNTKHRLENATNSPLVIIEIQTGSHFEEDDIIRFEKQNH